MGAAVVLWLVFWAGVGGLVGYAIGNGKGRGTEGFWLGLLLGFIGWIIVGVMSESEEHRNAQATALAAAVAQASASPADVPGAGSERSCPYCAETIKAAAKVCRFCGRDVEPLTADEVEAAMREAASADVDRVAGDYPNEFPIARPFLDALPTAPAKPGAWLAELCMRIQAGAPPERAAQRIPLDWSAHEPELPTLASAPTGATDPELAGKYPQVAEAFPQEYNAARTMLAGLAQKPENPAAWLEELCRRIQAGAPTELAAARIPLDWSRSTLSAHS